MTLAGSKPNFLIIGAAKSATTALSSMLDQHPQAAMVQGKEPHFFSMDSVYARGWDWYQSLYGHCRGQLAIGDASTSYSRIRYHPQVAARILKHVPDVKIIYMVRHPLERMVSAYVEWLATPGTENVFPSINEAVKRRPMIVDSSRYWEVFDHYRRHFDDARIQIVWFEEFVRDTARVFSEVCRFLEIDDSLAIPLPKERQNSRDAALTRARRLGRADVRVNTEWDPDVRRWVLNEIAEDNRRFLEYFRRPVDYWGSLY